MGTTPPIPPKQDIAKEVWKVATSLSDDAQNAAIRKARELGFDLQKGRISLEETFINLSHNRDVILDAVGKNKITQLPLKLQYALLLQTQKISESLTAMVNGADSLLGLEDSVEDLSSTIWQYNLHNLSEEVLGFHNKLNQIKAQETVIRRAHREAEEFENANSRAKILLQGIEAISKSASEQSEALKGSSDLIAGVVSKTQELEQQVAGFAVQAQHYDSTAAQYVSNAKVAAADIEALLAKSKSTQNEIDKTKSELDGLVESVKSLISSTGETITNSLGEFERGFGKLKEASEQQISSAQTEVEQWLKETGEANDSKIEESVASVEKAAADATTSVTELVTSTNARRAEAESEHALVIEAKLREFTQRAAEIESEHNLEHDAAVSGIKAKADAVVSEGETEFRRLTSELDKLEGRIRESIERATGYTLFHSFQKRQLDLAKSKRFWGIALAIAVLVSLTASGVFIYHLRFVTAYNAAFYLKLSISLPLIYAIAFCNVQYSRERRLEEEYAFKSSISISLDPYRKLVEQLVDETSPTEKAKYTAFVIDSVNRVFTSPTSVIFDDQPSDKNSAEKVIKAVGDIIEPLAKAIKK